MAIAIAIPLPSSASGARAALRAPLRGSPARVYTPFGQRRLARPMAIPLVDVDRSANGRPARSRMPFARLRRS